MKKRILIIFSVPLNTGDAALLEALEYGLIKKGIFEIKVACDNYEKVKQLYKYNVIENFEKSNVALSKSIGLYIRKLLRVFNLDKNIVKYIPLYLYPKYFKAIQDSDAIILAPGGYLNEYYDNEDRCNVLEKIQRIKPVYILGQSIGPFSQNSEMDRKVLGILRNMKLIVTREKISYDFLNKFSLNNLHNKQDLAFILHQKYEDQFLKRENKKIKRVAINFRKWNKDEELILDKAVNFCKFLIEKYDFEITFISTCQGVQGYVDDSKFMEKILSKLSLQNKAKVNNEFHTPEHLIKFFQDFDLYIGMRLHASILSLLAGTLAINIGYELKTEGIYEQFNSNLYVHYLDPIDSWLAKLDFVIENKEQLNNNLKNQIEHSSKNAEEAIDLFLRDINE